MRSFYKFMGVPGFEVEKTDVGFFTVSKKNKDRGKFVTPTLRELKHTGPYMHNGTLASLDQVVEFYNEGGGQGGLASELKSWNLSANEKKLLVAFLDSLSGKPLIIEAPKLQEYQTIANWRNKEN